MNSNLLGGYTRSEILSQPTAWQATLEQLASLASARYPDPSTYDHVAFSGCGSTYYLSQWAARQCQETCGVVASAMPASEILLFPEAWPQAGKKTLLVAVSRSAETTETVRAMEEYRARGYGDALSIVCYPERRLGRVSPLTLATPAGEESSVAQTRSFTSMMLGVLWLLRVGRPTDLPARLAGAANRVIGRYQGLAEALGREARLERFFFLGSGPLYGLACEAMLKMKEMSLSYAEAYHFLEFRHGPMSMVGPGSLVVGLLRGQGHDLELAVLSDMRALGAHILAVAEEAGSGLTRVADEVIALGNDLPSAWCAPLYLPCLQLLALHRALAKGLDADRPANLSAVVRLGEAGAEGAAR